MKKATRRIANGELQEFEDLDAFTQFLSDEIEDDEYFNSHVHLKYIPPFVMHESHNDVEKIKDSQNSKNKKFVRHLHHHIERHLLKDIQDKLGFDKEFENLGKFNDNNEIKWVYEDEVVGSGMDHDYKVKVEVKCHSDNAFVDVNYDTYEIK